MWHHRLHRLHLRDAANGLIDAAPCLLELRLVGMADVLRGTEFN
jgi:hypothetical protein